MRRGSIRGILVIIYLMAMAIAMILGLGIYQIVTEKEKLAKKYVQELELTKTCEDFIKLMVEQIDHHSLELTLNQSIISAFLDGNIESNVEVEKILNRWIVHNTAVKSVHMMGLNGELLSESNMSTNNYKKESFIEQFSRETLKRIDEKKGQIYVGIGNDFVGNNCEMSLFIARRINGTSHLESIGYMFYFLDIDTLKEWLENYLSRNHFELLIIDQNQQVLDFGDSNQLKELQSLYTKNQLSKEKKSEWESVYHHAEIESSVLEVQLLGQYIRAPLESDLTNIMIALSFINLIFLLLGIIAVRSIVIKPLERISSIARQISEEGVLTTRFEVDSSYREGHIITDALNEMLTKINELIKQVEERERQKRMLELSVINHQVNPHFLFNTLNSVSVLITVEDKNIALKLVKTLAKYYRACLSQDSTLNTIEQEVEIMKEYVHIIELKNPNLIRLVLDVNQEAYNKKIPRMILQTLVENSVKYGIKTIDEPLDIKMTIQLDHYSKRTIIEIYDNGKGMQESIKNSILQGISLKDKSGFGLKSTVKRISLMYEIENVSNIMEIDSKLNEYTHIKFYIPWEVKAKMYNKDAY